MPATTVRNIAFNHTTITAPEVAAIHLKQTYKEREPYEGLWHPFDGPLAKYGLSIPAGWLIYGFSKVPSWAFMVGISFLSRSIMLVFDLSLYYFNYSLLILYFLGPGGCKHHQLHEAVLQHSPQHGTKQLLTWKKHNRYLMGAIRNDLVLHEMDFGPSCSMGLLSSELAMTMVTAVGRQTSWSCLGQS